MNKLTCFVILALIVVIIANCKSKKEENNSSIDLSQLSTTNSQLPPVTFDDPQSSVSLKAIEETNKDGKNAVILVYEDNAPNCSEMLKNVNSFIEKHPEQKMKLFQLNRKNQSNNESIQRYNLSNAPVPLLLFQTVDGAIVGQVGLLNEEQISSLIPSPIKSKLISVIQKGKCAILQIEDKNNNINQPFTQVCTQAKQKINQNGEYLKISLTDDKEKTFLKELGIAGDNAKASLLVFNKNGQLTDRFLASPKIDELIASTTKVVKGGCAPGACGPGSGKSCPTNPPKN